jgi:hypothetical protein
MRGFLLVWAFITLTVGFSTFLAIYFTYSPPSESLNATPFIPGAPAQSVVMQVTPLPTNTALPTAVPTNTPPPTVEAQVAVTQPPTEPPTATPEPTLRPVDNTLFQAGIQVQHSLDMNPDNQDGFFRSVGQDLGLGWVKFQVRWEDVEVERDSYDWSKLDLVTASAQRTGIKIMTSILTTPDWAREPGVNLERHGPPANNQDFVSFVMKMLERYPGGIHAIEVWNETNLDREWTSTKGLSAANYTALLRDVYTAVKAYDPGIIIISGAPSPTGLDNGIQAIDDFTYVEQMIRAGALNYMDCLGAHHNGINFPPLRRYDEGYKDPTAAFRGPFDNPHHSWSFRSTLEGYAQRIRNNGSNIKLCVTEFGWASDEDLGGHPRGYEYAADNTLAEQAQWTSEALTFMEESDFVWLAFIWNLNYGPQAGWDITNDNVVYSLIGKDWVFRPAYDAVREWQAAYSARIGQN